MGILGEIKSDAAGAGALLGGIVAFVLLFWVYSAGGTWLLLAIVALIGLGYIVWMNRHMIG